MEGNAVGRSLECEEADAHVKKDVCCEDVKVVCCYDGWCLVDNGVERGRANSMER